MSLKIIDLFCGTGAFSLAFHQAGAETVLANDILESSEAIFNANNSDIRLTRCDVFDLNELPKADILTFGMPCQPYSIAGKQKGFEDERSNVFWKILDIIRQVEPKVFVFENVKNILSHGNGETFKIILNHFEQLNYFIKYEVLNTCKITGIPQNRERVYVVGFKDKDCMERFCFDFPEIDKNPISDYLENDVADKYYYKSNSSIYEELKKSVVEQEKVYQYRRYYVRENKNDVCPTLTANMGSGGHNVPIILDNKGIRKLTPRECFNLQGFPQEYVLPKMSDGKLYSLAGNAVSVPVVKLIANELINVL